MLTLLELLSWIGLGVALWGWLKSDPAARELLLEYLGFPGPSGTARHPEDRSARNRAAALLLFVALLVVVNPEARLLLLFVDAVGIDILLLLFMLQFRSTFPILAAAGASLGKAILKVLGLGQRRS